jgi:hypothetical protein
MITWECSISLVSGLGLRAQRAGGQLGERRLRAEHRSRPDDVGDAHARGREHRDAVDVAERQSSAAFVAGHDDQRRARPAPIGEQRRGGLGRGLLEGGDVEDRDGAALGVQRQGAAQRRAALLAVDLEGV